MKDFFGYKVERVTTLFVYVPFMKEVVELTNKNHVFNWVVDDSGHNFKRVDYYKFETPYFPDPSYWQFKLQNTATTAEEASFLADEFE